MRPPVTGAQALIGQVGRVRTPLVPNEPGLVDLRGEIWRAVSQGRCHPVIRFASSRVDGLTLTVEPADLIAPKGAD